MSDQTTLGEGVMDFDFKFDYINPNWNGKPEYDSLFIRAQEQFFNDKLVMRGHVFLNEVLDALGFQRLPQGQLEGWLRSDAPVVIAMKFNASDSSWDIHIKTAGEMYLYI